MAKLCTLLIVAGAALLPGAGVEPTRAQPAVDALFVLGDSLSDIGNAAAVADFLLDRPFYPEHPVGLCNPVDVYVFERGCADVIHRQSRVTDGAVAVEVLARELGLPDLAASFHTVPDRPVVGTNYAVAGAKARGAGVQDLERQADMLWLDHGPALPGDALYVVLIGGNDAMDALRAGARAGPRDAAHAAETIVLGAVDAIAEQVARLVDSGARELVVANLPGLASVPAVRTRARHTALGEEAALALAATVTATFNDLLAERLAGIALARPQASIVEFDMHGFFEALYRTADRDGINASEACFDSAAYRASPLARRRFHPECAPSAGGSPLFDLFIFWDDLHPTGHVHAALGQAMTDAWRGGSSESGPRASNGRVSAANMPPPPSRARKP